MVWWHISNLPNGTDCLHVGILAEKHRDEHAPPLEFPTTIRPAVTKVVVQGRCEGWKDMDQAVWEAFCEDLRTALPSIKSLSVVDPNHLGDGKLVVLLSILMPLLHYLELRNMDGELPCTMKQIGALKSLQELLVWGKGHGWNRRTAVSPAIGSLVATSLRELPHLEYVSLQDFGVNAGNQTEAIKVCKPIFDAIAGNPRLLGVHVGNLWWPELRANSFPQPQTMDMSEIAPSLQFGPRLNEAMRQGDPMTAHGFVKALISVRDRVDCLDWLLREVDPVLYAKQAVAGRV